MALTSRGKAAVAGGAVVAVLAGGMAALALSGNAPDPVQEALHKIGVAPAPPEPCPLTGETLPGDKQPPDRPLLAVKVDKGRMPMEEFVRVDTGGFGPTGQPPKTEKSKILLRVRRIVRAHAELEKLAKTPPRSSWTEKQRKEYDKKRAAYRSRINEELHDLKLNGKLAEKFVERLKDTLDPAGILAPGKQGIWPAAYRDRE